MTERKKGSSLTKIESKPLLYASFVDVFISPKFELVSALSTIVVTKEIGLQIAEALLNIFEIYSDQTPELMKWAVSHEIEQATTTTTLFRGASSSARLMSAFYKKVGATYLKNILSPWLTEVSNKSGSYEVDPLKIAPTDNIEENQKKLHEITEKVLDNILNSVDQCPVAIRNLLSHAKEKVSQKFPDMGHSVIGGSIFLRFICPAIVAPTESGLLQDMPGPDIRRALVLVSKLLQNLANELLFEMKESYMLPFNPFLTANIPRIREFFSQITSPPRRDSNPLPKFFPLPNEEVLTDNINILHQTVADNREKIGKYIEKAHPSNFASLFLSRLDDALSSTANLKKKRLSFFGRSKGKTQSHVLDEDLRTSLPRRALHDLGIGSGSDRDSDKESHSPTTSPTIPHESRRSNSNSNDPESVERLFKNQVDMFVTFFGSKLKEKDKQLQEALESSPNASPRVPRSHSETAMDGSSEVVRLRVENAELMKQVKALHEENCKLREMVKRNAAEADTATQLQQATFDLVARTRADVDRIATLLIDQEEHKQRKRASRERRSLQKSSSKDAVHEHQKDKDKQDKHDKHENHKKHENHEAPDDNEKEVDEKKSKENDIKAERKLERKPSGSSQLDALLSKVSSEQQARFVELFEMELI